MAQPQHPDSDRFRKIRTKYNELKNKANKEAQKTEVKPAATEIGVNPVVDVERATIRKMISEAMYEDDKKLPPEQQQEIIDRQINRFFKYEQKDPTIKGHVESQHGARITNAKIRLFCMKNRYSSFEVNTQRIAARTTNNMLFTRPRIFTDVNNLSKKDLTSLRSENACFTHEYNMNGVKAERDLISRFMENSGNLTPDHQAKNPYLAITLHGKTDSRGHDFEIAAAEINNRTPLDPRLAFWIAEKLRAKVQSKGIKGKNSEPASVNVVAYKGAYSGSGSTRKQRYGDELFEFKGFGEMFQALQLECGKHIRVEYQNQLVEILNELIREFSEEFKTSADLAKLQQYSQAVVDKIQQEKNALFLTSNIMHSDDYPVDKISLSMALCGELGVKVGEKVICNGVELIVEKISPKDGKTGKTIKLHSSHAITGAIIDLKKA